ncbi:MAG: hypothetical protein C0404_11435 [Verrucomicrobia bacterium]|nr:hypothetical protein [Verrucomicrobiota bacterium]
MLASAFGFLAELVPQAGNPEEAKKTTDRLKEQLAECLEKDEQGNVKMTITLPDPAMLSTMAESLARLVSFAGAPR